MPDRPSNYMGTRGVVRGTLFELTVAPNWPCQMTKRLPFRYFKTSPELIRLAEMLYLQLFPRLRKPVADQVGPTWNIPPSLAQYD